MSVYSGFATRQQEKRYNECLEFVLSVLTKRLTRFYLGESCNDAKFKYILISIHDKMQQLEENKYMEPNYSYILNDFLKSTAEVFDQVGHLSRMKEEDPFNQTFSKLHDSHIKVKFNTINMHQNEQEDFELEQQPNRNSRKTLNERKVNFKTRIKTVTPQYQPKPNYFTPQKKSSFDVPLEVKREKIQRERQIFTGSVEHPKHNPHAQLQRLQHSSKNRPLSPRQFLRQTVKGKQTFSHMALRTKQKHQKIVKV